MDDEQATDDARTPDEPDAAPDDLDLEALIAELTAPFGDETPAQPATDGEPATAPSGADDDGAEDEGGADPAAEPQQVEHGDHPDQHDAHDRGAGPLPPTPTDTSLSRREIAELLRELSSLAAGQREPGDGRGGEQSGRRGEEGEDRGKRGGLFGWGR